MATLTPNQEKTCHQLRKLLAAIPAVIVHGESGTGKDHIVDKYLKEISSRVTIVRFDICDISLAENNPLHPSNFYSHLIEKLERVNPDKPSCFYIRHWNKIKEIMEDYNINHRYFPRYALSRFIDQLKLVHQQIIVTADQDPRVDTAKHWSIEHRIDQEDVRFFLGQHFSQSDVEAILPHAKKAKIGHLHQAISYTKAFPDEETLFRLKEALVKIYGSSLDPARSIVETMPKINLIGLEQILETIETSIIGPMQLSLDQVPLKKGIVLAGPPGTGKTSIGRWLTYRLRGKLYLVDGYSGVSGNTLFTAINDAIEQAKRNAPAVVFIDDVDLFFDQPDTYRSFLTLLDGLENKHRGGVCIIVTCMDIAKIPSSLIRGNRLELCLETQLPDLVNRQRILRLGFDRMLQLIQRLGNEGKINSIDVGCLSRDFNNDDFVRYVASQMGSWNYADIQRYLDDVLRTILCDPNSKGVIKIRDITTKIIANVRRQYHLVRRPEEKADTTYIYS